MQITPECDDPLGFSQNFCLCCRFVPAKLDEMFTKHAKTVPNALTKDELDEMLKDNREKMDVAGW
jgi:hypothetical protein